MRPSVRFGLLAAAMAESTRVCTPAASEVASWPFNVSTGAWYSCASSAGSTNDLGTSPQMCEGDPSSVRIALTPTVGAECLVAHAESCKIDMHEFASLDYDYAIFGCMGVWAAPLWLTPDLWQWGGGSGEIDATELCPRTGMFLNFAGGGHQVKSGVDIDDAVGHVTVRKDSDGIVTIAACTREQADANDGQCTAPQYSGCDDCLNGTDYGCWCSEPLNIYGSGGCQDGGDCMWTLVSDVSLSRATPGLVSFTLWASPPHAAPSHADLEWGQRRRGLRGMHDGCARPRAERVATEPANRLRVLGRARAGRRAGAHGRLRGGISAHDGRLQSGSAPARLCAAPCADCPRRVRRARRRVRCDRGHPLVSPPSSPHAPEAVKASIRRDAR